MKMNQRFEGINVQLDTRPRYLEGAATLRDGQIMKLRLTWQAWESATGQPGPTLPEPEDTVALRAAWLAATDDNFTGRTVGSGFRLVEANYISQAIRLSDESN